MFSYCNNSPVIYHDSTGNAPISYHNGDRNPLFIGHVGIGGGSVGGGYPGCGGQGNSGYKDFFDEVSVKNRKAIEVIGSTLEDGYNKQQEAKMREAEMTLDAVKKIYGTLEDNGGIAVGKVSYKSYQAANEFKKTVFYLGLPIPTPVDEAFAIGHAVKGLYHFVMSIMEAIKWIPEN